MASLIAGIADAVVDRLKSQQWGVSFTAVRLPFARYELSQFTMLRVTVLVGRVFWEVVSREKDKIEEQIEIVVQKRVNPANTAEVDPLYELLELFVAHFRALELTAGTGAAARRIVCMGSEFVSPGPAVPLEHLQDLSLFTAVLRLTWVVR